MPTVTKIHRTVSTTVARASRRQACSRVGTLRRALAVGLFFVAGAGCASTQPQAGVLATETGTTIWGGPEDAALAAFARTFDLHAVARGDSEVARLVAVRDWVHRRWDHDSWNTPSRHESSVILLEAAKGARFRCAEYALVLADVYRALGWHARVVRFESPKGAHVATEVRRRETGAWMLMDGQFAAHIESGGEGLSAFGVRERLRNRATAGLVVRHGAKSAPEGDYTAEYLGFLAQYLDVVMVSRNLTFGKQFEAFLVASDNGKVPARKPPYLAGARYLAVPRWEVLYWEQPDRARP